MGRPLFEMMGDIEPFNRGVMTDEERLLWAMHLEKMNSQPKKKEQI